ncbi:hypothetical protein ACJIZ3_019863 [Penstemon smallii]|uniref:Transposase-associated domain-containing protein n=1 Tax=Penstemon smallii TaxID=265156 RepID=A0ABD3T368_9LAMI
MDKSWIEERDRFSSKYIAGVESFINFSRENGNTSDNKILCPCNNCRNTKKKSFIEVKRDLHLNGFYLYYRKWIFHGEPNVSHHSSFNRSTHTSVPSQNENPDFGDGGMALILTYLMNYLKC